MDRRSFLKIIPVTAILPVLAKPFQDRTRFAIDEDERICSEKFYFSITKRLAEKPVNMVVLEMGKSFIGTEYIANSLEQIGEERLVVNLRGLDCVTLCENALVLARCIKKNHLSFENYKAGLQFIRYRGGVIHGYPSRLHYFSDYIYDNVQKGVLKDVTLEIGGTPYNKKIDFMSSHPEAYPPLKEHPEFIGIIRQQEASINSRALYHIPKEDIEKFAPKIHDGDILAITTAIEGIDISHTGIAVWQGEKLHFLHAPDIGYKVQITEKPLSEYLASHAKQMGIMVARPVEVV